MLIYHTIYARCEGKLGKPNNGHMGRERIAKTCQVALGREMACEFCYGELF